MQHLQMSVGTEFNILAYKVTHRRKKITITVGFHILVIKGGSTFKETSI